MINIDFLLQRFSEKPEAPALGWRGEELPFKWLRDEVLTQATQLAGQVNAGDKVVLQSDFSPRSVAMLFALIHLKAILIPLLPATLARAPRLREIADADVWIEVSPEQKVQVTRLQAGTPHEHVKTLRSRKSPGLVLFTSGSTGEPKGVVHDFAKLLQKFTVRRPAMRCLNFLLFDHWGGLNTLLHNLSNGGLVVLPEQRQPDYICGLIEKHKIELLPASPTFLNLLLMSRAFEGKDLSSLRIVSYGSEPMLPSTLKSMMTTFPGLELRQTYGLIELGVLRAKSKSSDSLLVKIGGEGFDVRVVDNLLQIKADSAMLGYLNAPSPFTEDGYFMTGDRVEVAADGEYMRILGRQSELINVGGQKVYPAEVEDVLLTHEEVADAVVFGERHPITGSIVCSKILLKKPCTDESAMRRSIKAFSAARLDAFKVPVKISFSTEALHGDRMKRVRLQPSEKSR